MTSSFLLARGGVEANETHAWSAWACTGCFACRQSCDLRNDVAGTLLDARADFLSGGIAPIEAKRVVERHAARVQASDDALVEAVARAKDRGANVAVGAATRLLVGCMTARASSMNERHEKAANEDDVAADAIVATSRLVDGAIDVVKGCCGAPLRMAGDRAGFVDAARAFVDRIGAKTETLVVADAGCAHAIARRYAEVDAHVPARVRVMHLSELAAREIDRIPPSKNNNERMRYHDACALGRGLGVYEAPRAVLTRLLGRAPDEFARRREQATCSGGGGVLPVTYGDNARAIADERLRQHAELGGGAVATTCASSRKMLGRDGTRVVDLATLIARAFARS
jgi:Fe-S oxidoreductase